jgi:uncharacterized protein YdiU (UPF0061 family)
MAKARADFTLSFRHLADAAEGNDGPLRALFEDPGDIDAWLGRWRARLSGEADAPGARAARMRAINPLYIPRNHVVEEVLSAAVAERDFSPFETMLAAITRPFEERAEFARYAISPTPEQAVLRTFCGT